MYTVESGFLKLDGRLVSLRARPCNSDSPAVLCISKK